MKRISFTQVLLIIAAVFVIILIYNNGCDKNDNSSKSKKVTKDEWYVGGTLHKAKISEWKNATEKNKLATCADFMVNINNTLSAVELKRTATELKNCINEATRGVDDFNEMTVAEFVVLCAGALEYEVIK